jgi:hypothetical protein
VRQVTTAGAAGTPPGGRYAARWRRWVRRDEAEVAKILDLTDVDEVTTTLLAPPQEFQGLRRRVVDQFTILSANRCRLARSVNWGPLDGLLAQIVPAVRRVDTRGRLTGEVSLLLPVSTLPKRALVAFDLRGPSGSDAHLMPYTVSVAIQGNLVALLAAGIGRPVPEPARRMVDAISRFRPGRLSSNWPELLRGGEPLTLGAIGDYLVREAGLTVDASLLRAWQGIVAPAQETLAEALAEPFDPLSSAETLLLAVGELWRDPDVPAALGVNGIETHLREFAAWVEHVRRAGEPAVPVLTTVAEYGRRWEALAEVTCDPYRPVLIKMLEERRTVLARRSPVRDGVPWWRWVTTPVAVVDLDPGSISSYHVSIGTDDTSVEIRNPVMLDLFDARVERTYVEDVQRNREVYAFYITDAGRPPRSRLVVGLSVSRDVSRVTTAIGTLMALTVGLSALPFELGADAVAVVAIPSSFAATVLLTRERSSLAAWVLGPAKTMLLALLVLLALLSGMRALGWHTPQDQAPAQAPMSEPARS